MSKVCGACKESLPDRCFNTRDGGKYLRSDCKSCASGKGVERTKQDRAAHRLRSLRSRLKHFYGITHEEYLAMEEAQGNCCAICKAPKASLKGRGWCTDHCHTTGKVRGLLCTSCNKGLGLFKDDPTKLEAAVEYLRI